jgi:Zn-dependent protease/CBS domain-containing protein
VSTGGIRLGRLAGVEIRVDWSLLIIFALVTYSLGAGVFPDWHPGWGPALTWSVALGAAVLFFASILAHELSHALVARRMGIPVRAITLFLFGGMAHMEGEPPSPKAEFWMAIVGPLTSFAIGFGAVMAGTALAGSALEPFSSGQPDPEQLREALAGAGPLPTLLLWLGPINVLLGAFNLVPGFPLDGGRVLRSIIWWATGDLERATRWASGVGRGFAWMLMGLGVLNVFHGDLSGGLWLVLIGWFLNNAARASYAQLMTRRALQDVPVRRVMWTAAERVAPDLSLEELVREHLMPGDQVAFPVEADGRLVGLVVFDDVRRVPQSQWAQTTVGQVMTPTEKLITIGPDAGAEQALSELARGDVNQLPVTEGDHLEGMVRRRDLVRWIALSQQQRAA